MTTGYSSGCEFRPRSSVQGHPTSRRTTSTLAHCQSPLRADRHSGLGVRPRLIPRGRVGWVGLLALSGTISPINASSCPPLVALAQGLGYREHALSAGRCLTSPRGQAQISRGCSRFSCSVRLNSFLFERAQKSKNELSAPRFLGNIGCRIVCTCEYMRACVYIVLYCLLYYSLC